MSVFANQKLDRQVGQALLDDSPAEQEQCSVGERRRSFRRPLGVVATISRIIGSELVHPLQVLVLNVSEHGYGLRSPAALMRGELYHLRIGGADAARSRTLRIKSCRHRPDELFDVGAEVAD